MFALPCFMLLLPLLMGKEWSNDGGAVLTAANAASTSSNRRASIQDLVFQGAFRLTPSGSETLLSDDYAVGTLAYNPARNSLYIAGHAQQSPVAEYPIVEGGFGLSVADLPESGAPLQTFVDVLDRVSNPEGIDRVTGMMVVDDRLIINAEDWYDAGADNLDTTLVFDANNLNGGTVSGYFQLQGRANCAGYMGKIPTELQQLFGGARYYTGWSSVYSILARHSQGPSLWTFDPNDLSGASTEETIPTTAYMNYDYNLGSSGWLSPRSVEWAAQGTPGPFDPSDPLWNPLSSGIYGFFIPNSKTFCVIGSTAGISSGMGYKAVQSNGYVCGGPCPYDPLDWHNYYWLFDAEDIVSAREVNEPRPYAYGEWKVPYTTSPEDHRIIGATLDDENQLLYVALSNAGRLGEYDRPPLILSFSFSTTGDGPAPAPIDNEKEEQGSGSVSTGMMQGPLFCFSPTNYVSVLGKTHPIMMSNLKVGDHVQVDHYTYEQVFGFGHYDLEAKNAVYHQIYTALSDQEPIEISGEHLIFVQQEQEGKSKGHRAVPVSTLVIGDNLVTSSGTTTKIVRIETAKRQGMLAPFTKSGTIIVNGIRASTFVTLQQDSANVRIIVGRDSAISWHWLGQISQAPHRVACWFDFERFCQNETYDAESGISVWVKPMYEVAQWIFKNTHVDKSVGFGELMLGTTCLLFLSGVAVLEVILVGLKSAVSGIVFLMGLMSLVLLRKSNRSLRSPGQRMKNRW